MNTSSIIFIVMTTNNTNSTLIISKNSLFEKFPQIQTPQCKFYYIKHKYIYLQSINQNRQSKIMHKLHFNPIPTLKSWIEFGQPKSKQEQ